MWCRSTLNEFLWLHLHCPLVAVDNVRQLQGRKVVSHPKTIPSTLTFPWLLYHVDWQSQSKRSNKVNKLFLCWLLFFSFSLTSLILNIVFTLIIWTICSDICSAFYKLMHKSCIKYAFYEFSITNIINYLPTEKNEILVKVFKKQHVSNLGQ